MAPASAPRRGQRRQERPRRAAGVRPRRRAAPRRGGATPPPARAARAPPRPPGPAAVRPRRDGRGTAGWAPNTRRTAGVRRDWVVASPGAAVSRGVLLYESGGRARTYGPGAGRAAVRRGGRRRGRAPRGRAPRRDRARDAGSLPPRGPPRAVAGRHSRPWRRPWRRRARTPARPPAPPPAAGFDRGQWCARGACLGGAPARPRARAPGLYVTLHAGGLNSPAHARNSLHLHVTPTCKHEHNLEAPPAAGRPRAFTRRAAAASSAPPRAPARALGAAPRASRASCASWSPRRTSPGRARRPRRARCRCSCHQSWCSSAAKVLLGPRAGGRDAGEHPEGGLLLGAAQERLNLGGVVYGRQGVWVTAAGRNRVDTCQAGAPTWG
jgi:hypothetical protein